MVAKWHSHHTAHVGETLSLGWWDEPRGFVAVVVMGRPSARPLAFRDELLAMARGAE